MSWPRYYIGPVHIAPAQRADIHRRLAEASETTREAYAAFEPKPHFPPRMRCPTCKGTGLETWTGPHAGSCSGCRGFRWVDMTVENMRDEYRRLRAETCARIGTTPSTFDAMAGASTGDDDTPAAWLYAAREIARPR